MNRCRKCKNCLKDNCGFCVACKDMRQFGGKGTRKLSCLTRPKCLNVVIPTLEKRENIHIQNVVKTGGEKRKFEKDKNENVIKPQKISKVYYDSDLDQDIIPPYVPRVFPMSDADYNTMMMEEMDNGDAKEGVKAEGHKTLRYKEILTRSWRVTGPGPRLRYEASDDFEDTREEVFKQRHARAARELGIQEMPEDDQNHRVETSENNMDEAGPSTDTREVEDTTYKIPFVSEFLEVKLPGLSNFEEEPNLRAIIRGSKLRGTKIHSPHPDYYKTPKKEILPEKIEELRTRIKVLRTRRSSGAKSKAG